MRVAALLGALSTSCDLADGFAIEKCLRTTILAARLAGLAGADPATCYFAALLRFLGCTAAAVEEDPLSAGDDIGLRRALAMAEPGNLVSFARQVAGGVATHASLPVRARAIARLMGDPSAPMRHAVAQCEVGAAFARAMGIEGVVSVLSVRDERWDGRGPRRAAAGDELPLPARIADVADAAELYAWHYGAAAALRELSRRRGGQLDPGLVDAFLGAGPEIWADLFEASVWELFLDSEPEPRRTIQGDEELDRILTAWASFGDLSSRYTLGHSPRVASLASAAMSALGGSREDGALVRRAGLLHDLGRVAVPVGIWDKPGPLSPVERERVRQHSAHTEAILRLAPDLSHVADIAGATHERGGRRGYHRRLNLRSEPLAVQVLAAADVCVALGSERAHRKAYERAAVGRELSAQVKEGLLEARAVDAVLGAAELPRPRPPPQLTEREIEVAKLVAVGRTNPEIGALLGISARTAQKHVMNVYGKVGRESRAGLALWVVEHGLLD